MKEHGRAMKIEESHMCVLDGTGTKIPQIRKTNKTIDSATTNGSTIGLFICKYMGNSAVTLNGPFVTTYKSNCIVCL